MQQYWIDGLFKDKQVWVLCDSAGNPVIDGGYVHVRYGETSPKVYRGSRSNLSRVGTNIRAIDIEDPSHATITVVPPVADKSTSSAKSKNAKAVPTAPITPPRPGSIVLYTDGACSGNPGPAGLGVMMQDGEKKRELSGYLGVATNNIAELDAIRQGLMLIADKQRPVDLYTDSNYAIGVLTKGWKAKANTELVEEIRDLLEDFRNIRFHWVRGHMGHDGNERADELARLAIEKKKTQTFGS